MNRILIVEDDKDISRELKELLENSGYEAVVLTDFKNACDSIIAAEPDLVLLDINIPYMNGEMLLQQLRSKSDVPVIMVTSRDSEADEVLSMSYGADDYIAKPYNPTILLLMQYLRGLARSQIIQQLTVEWKYFRTRVLLSIRMMR